MQRLRASSAGFSLIEVMIVLVIIAVLLLIAVPGYQESMKKSRRADGMRDLMELTARQERFYAQYSRYTDDIGTADGLNLKRTTSSEGHYNLKVKPCEDEGLVAYCGDEAEVEDEEDISTCYVLQAVPKDKQENDTQCATLCVDSRGQRSASGSLGDACW
jgi:type IV pilus assembly protein PilE